MEILKKLPDVDDNSIGADKTVDAINIFRGSKEILFKTNMNLLKRKSNSKQVNE